MSAALAQSPEERPHVATAAMTTAEAEKRFQMGYPTIADGDALTKEQNA